MTETGILNRDLAAALARMGHRDELCITDAGLAIAEGLRCIDLSVRDNLPRFLDVLETVLEHFSVEKVVIAEETRRVSPTMCDRILQAFGKEVEVSMVPHREFVERSRGVKAAVRTGEFTAYCNVILVSGANAARWHTEVR